MFSEEISNCIQNNMNLIFLHCDWSWKLFLFYPFRPALNVFTKRLPVHELAISNLRHCQIQGHKNWNVKQLCHFVAHTQRVCVYVFIVSLRVLVGKHTSSSESVSKWHLACNALQLKRANVNWSSWTFFNNGSIFSWIFSFIFWPAWHCDGDLAAEFRSGQTFWLVGNKWVIKLDRGGAAGAEDGVLWWPTS